MFIIDLVRRIPPLKRCLRRVYLRKKAESFAKISAEGKTDEKLIVFESFQGRSCSCSPKAIYEYMLGQERFASYRYVWIFRDTEAHGGFPENTRLVRYDSEESFRAYADAGTWIVNSRLRDFIVPRPDQRYVQCWHGTPFKRIGCDVTAGDNATSTAAEIYEEYKNDAEKINCFLSPSDYVTEKLVSAFALENADKVIQQGYPRNDALFEADSDKCREIKRALGIPFEKKVVLYCPTFRDNSYGKLGYTLSIQLDIERLCRYIMPDTVLLFRAHYFVDRGFELEKYSGFMYDVSDHDDVNELYLISDILVTDYSSVFFDYANLCRPMIFYLYDLDEYENEMRGFYFGADKLPGPVVKTQEELEDTLIRTLDDLKNGGDGLFGRKKQLDEFNERFNPLEDGHSAERNVKKLFG